MQDVPATGMLIALATAIAVQAVPARASAFLDSPRPVVMRQIAPTPMPNAPFTWLQGPPRPAAGLPVVQRPAPSILSAPGGRTLASYRARALPGTQPPPDPVPIYRMPAPSPQQSGELSCVPFARLASGIDLKGDALTWWEKAAGSYSRGRRPELGSVLTFRATDGMRLGHVAVVSRLLGARLIMVDHANWGGAPGRVMRGVPVTDVSPDNDWTQVRLTVSATGAFGSTYPTHGFIYRRPDTAAVFVNR